MGDRRNTYNDPANLTQVSDRSFPVLVVHPLLPGPAHVRYVDTQLLIPFPNGNQLSRQRRNTVFGMYYQPLFRRLKQVPNLSQERQIRRLDAQRDYCALAEKVCRRKARLWTKARRDPELGQRRIDDSFEAGTVVSAPFFYNQGSFDSAGAQPQLKFRDGIRGGHVQVRIGVHHGFISLIPQRIAKNASHGSSPINMNMREVS